MRPLALVPLLFLVACGGTSPAPCPAAPQAAASPAEDAFAACARAAAIAEKNGKPMQPKEAGRCVFELSEMRDANPERFACISGCLAKKETPDDVEACILTGCAPKTASREEDLDHEATSVLGAIETGSKNQLQMETDTSGTGAGPYVHRFCPSSGPVPAIIPSADAPVPIDPAAGAPTWKCLKVSLPTESHWQYDYENNDQIGVDARIVVTAKRKLEGGRIRTMTYVGGGSPTGDMQRISLTIRDE